MQMKTTAKSRSPLSLATPVRYPRWMTLPQLLGITSGVLLTAGYLPYIYEVFKKKTIPNRMSWFIWSLSTATILFGVHETGTNEAIWVPIADAVGCFVIFLLSLRFGVGGSSTTDRISLLVCVMSLVGWWLTGNALLALVLNLCIYVSGYVPTIKKALDDPTSESSTAWMLFFSGVVLNLLTVAIGTDSGIAVWLYPITLVGVVGTLVAVLLFKKTKHRLPT